MEQPVVRIEQPVVRIDIDKTRRMVFAKIDFSILSQPAHRNTVEQLAKAVFINAFKVETANLKTLWNMYGTFCVWDERK